MKVYQYVGKAKKKEVEIPGLAQPLQVVPGRHVILMDEDHVELFKSNVWKELSEEEGMRVFNMFVLGNPWFMRLAGTAPAFVV